MELYTFRPLLLLLRLLSPKTKLFDADQDDIRGHGKQTLQWPT